jgi:TRAP-type C4-dicarboxylate transport system permease large subunit
MLLKPKKSNRNMIGFWFVTVQALSLKVIIIIGYFFFLKTTTNKGQLASVFSFIFTLMLTTVMTIVFSNKRILGNKSVFYKTKAD